MKLYRIWKVFFLQHRLVYPSVFVVYLTTAILFMGKCIYIQLKSSIPAYKHTLYTYNIHTCTFIHICINASMQNKECLHVCTVCANRKSNSLYVLYIQVYIHIYVCMHICMYIHIYSIYQVPSTCVDGYWLLKVVFEQLQSPNTNLLYCLMTGQGQTRCALWLVLQV